MAEAVCKSWQSIAAIRKRKNRHFTPLLLLTNDNADALPHSDSPLLPVIASFDGLLAFAKQGDQVWTFLTTPLNLCTDLGVVYMNGLLYAIDTNGTLFVCDISVCPPKGIQIEASPPYDLQRLDRLSRVHLVDIAGEVHLVVRLVDYIPENCDYITDSFSIYKFAVQTNSWIQVSDLGESALFIGSGGMSFVVPTCDCPELKHYAIYYSCVMNVNDHHSNFFDFFDMSVHDIGRAFLFWKY